MATEHGNVMTIDELSTYLKVSKSMLYHFGRDGKLPGIRGGRHRRFHKNAIDEWMRKGRRFTIGGKE